jgi:hypothetical protein
MMATCQCVRRKTNERCDLIETNVKSWRFHCSRADDRMFLDLGIAVEGRAQSVPVEAGPED